MSKAISFETAKMIVELADEIKSSVCEEFQNVLGKVIPIFVEPVWVSDNGYAGEYRFRVFSGDNTGNLVLLSNEKIAKFMQRYLGSWEKDHTTVEVRATNKKALEHIRDDFKKIGVGCIICETKDSESGTWVIDILKEAIAEKEAKRLAEIRKEREVIVKAKLLIRKNAKFLAKFPVCIPGTYAKSDFVPAYASA